MFFKRQTTNVQRQKGRSSGFPPPVLPSQSLAVQTLNYKRPVALYGQALSMGDYSCRNSSGFTPDSLASGSYCHPIASLRLQRYSFSTLQQRNHPLFFSFLSTCYAPKPYGLCPTSVRSRLHTRTSSGGYPYRQTSIQGKTCAKQTIC